MTNHQSLATVTAVLSQLVQGFAASAIDGAKVTTERPDHVQSNGLEAVANRVNLYLFLVNFDPTFRNHDLPTRDRAGQVVQRPRAALQLHYLLSFYGDESVLAPQRMLASVVAGLHARPFISMERVAAFVAANQDANEPFHYLADSRLAEQGESVRLTPDTLNLEELSKLWSVFFQVPYALSIAYKASVVLVDAPEAVRSSGLPVRTPVVTVRADHTPISLTSVRPSDGKPSSPVFRDSALTVTGSGFVGEGLEGRIDGGPAPVVVQSPSELTLALGALALRAGPRVLQIARPGGASSGGLVFGLRPRVTGARTVGAGDDQRVQVDADVTVGHEQPVEILLDEKGGAQRRFSLAALPREADQARAEARREGVPAGTYLVRLRIEGVESVLAVDAGGLSTGPLLVLA